MAPAGRARQTVTVTADLVILTIRDERLHVLLVERANEPFAGRPALPGGFLRGRESLRATAERELREETGLDPAQLHLEQVGVYSEPDRDPRDPRVITCAFLSIAPNLPLPTAGTDAKAASWVPVDEAGHTELAFDHNEILADAVELARDEIQFTTVATAFCGPEFTIGDLRAVYEAVWGAELDKPNFHRKVTDATGFVVATGGKRAAVNGRPAALYRAGGARLLMPPMIRPRR